MCYQNRAHFTRYGLKLDLAKKKLLSHYRIDLYTQEFFTLNPESMHAGRHKGGGEELFMLPLLDTEMDGGGKPV